MDPVHIKGFQDVIGLKQGYAGLPIRHGHIDGHPVLQTAWKATKEELAILQAGGAVIITLLYPPEKVNPMMVQVLEAEHCLEQVQ